MNYIAEVISSLEKKLPNLPPELLDLYVLLAFTTNASTTLEDVHDAWAIWKNRIRPDHKSLIPFDELSLEVQELDAKYKDAICAVAHEILVREDVDTQS